MSALPEAFLKRMEALLGADFPAFLASYDEAPLRALRVNTDKISPADFAALSPWKLAPLCGRPDAFLLLEDAPGIGKHPYHMAGLFYVQEPSAMAPVYALGPQRGTRVLDLCAAPGGKATALAARLGAQGLLVANETVPGRARTLLLNLERMGAANTVVTNMRPEALSRALPGFFDAALVDAPCSGEGMFRKDPEALQGWSEKHVAACARRQMGILESADRALRPGGRLLYSTCTFAPEENERLCAAFLQSHPDYRLLHEARLYPHRGEGEGQYYALLEKAASAAPAAQTAQTKKAAPARTRAKGGPDAAHRLAEELRALFPGLSFCAEDILLLPDGRAFLPPPSCGPAWGKGLHILSMGLALGTLETDGRFEPSQALFLCHGAACARKLSFAPGDARLAAFLRGESIPLLPGEAGDGKGYGSVCVDGYPLGFGRFAQGLCKNRLPKGLRH